MTEEAPEGGNRLAGEKSPYLLQHATNPVDWHPWGEEAFEKARRQDKPLFVSIGYATCHWCHVMERESFEDERVAELLNEVFVPVKVDREERPDVDGVYMTACQMLTGSGGWPLNVALTPEKRPFFAGTYFPRETRGGRIGMLDLVPRLGHLWEERREDVERSAREIVTALERAGRPDEGAAADPETGPVPSGGASRGAPDAAALRWARERLAASHDDLQGGFGRAPKFPTPHNLLFLLRAWRRGGEAETLAMVERTLDAMRRGGIRDHVGFGFHRYSTDARWLLPHFEKMLYDQALLALAYTEAHQATGGQAHRRTAEETLAYVLRELTGPHGAFLSAEDADSEGREGAFYLWTAGELEEALDPEEAALARRVWNVERRGNFADEATGERTGHNVLHLRKPLSQVAADEGMTEAELRERLEAVRARLFEVRERRPRPLLDDKVLTDWNGLAIAALARAARAFGEPRYLTAAERAVAFVESELRDADGRLLHRWREGEAAVPGTADDHAFLAWGRLELWEAGRDPEHLAAAVALVEALDAWFWDGEEGGYHLTAHDAERLPVRRKETYDGALPSSNSVALLVLARLARITGRTAWEERAWELAGSLGPLVRRAPEGHTMFLTGVDFLLGPSREVLVAGRPEEPDTRALLEALDRSWAPEAVRLFKPLGPEGEEAARRLAELAPWTEAHEAAEGSAAAWVCTDFACERPLADPAELAARLSAAPRRGDASS